MTRPLPYQLRPLPQSHIATPRCWRRAALAVGAAGAAALLGACGAMHHGPGQMGHMGPSATATMAPTTGNSARGQVVFHQHGDHVMVMAKLNGLPSNAVLGFHVHEKGDCSSSDGSSAGGHFNPTGQPHGPQGSAHHAGDMPSLKVDASGNVDTRFHLSAVTVAPGPSSVVGRGLIVHAGPDDYATQPTGNSGARIACGVISAS